ncbi:MAG: ABC transporter ATP-binding protein [Firmicutes bacterium]|nr:ABC transporter ATP-binding protein [Bacillota bacterium]
MVEAEGVHKSFGAVQALKDLSLLVRRGETLGLLGPNGSGKTTLIRIIAGVLRADQGTVRVDGIALPSPAAAARTGYMTQAAALYEDLSVRENLSFFARLYGLRPGGDLRRRVDELLALVRLEEKRDTPVRHLSGGMRQRANLAASLIHRPSLLLLDEPTVGVDPRLRQNLWEHLGRLVGEGATILVSTHVMDEAERCERVAFISEGRVTALDTPAALKQRAGARTLEEAFLLSVDGMPSANGT